MTTSHECSGIHHADHFIKDRGDCWTCWIASKTPAPAEPEKPSSYPCMLRDDTGARLGLGTCAEGCPKGKRFPVRACSKHGTCVVAVKTKEGHQCCKTCPDRVPPPTAPKVKVKPVKVKPIPPPPPVKSPSEILTASGTDKIAKHGYGVLYDAMLAGKCEAKAILEIGVLDGASIRAWSEIFPQAEIVAADVNPDCAAAVAGVPRVTFVRLDAGDPEALDAFAQENADRFDLIVDDASHDPASQLLVRERLWPTLRTGGVLVIEDIRDDETYLALEIQGGRGWDFRKKSGEFDSRCMTYERTVIPDLRSGLPRVLFATQDLSLTGAPMILANVVPQLRGFVSEVYSPIAGPLANRFRNTGIRLTHDLDLAGVDLVVANTIVSAPVVAAAKAAGVPCVWMIHESDPAMCGNLDEVRAVIDYPIALVFPCRATANAYTEILNERARIDATGLLSIRRDASGGEDKVRVPEEVRNGGRERGRVRGDDRGGLDAEARVVIVPSIIPPVPVRDRWPDEEGPFYIVSLGTDEPRKGHSDIRTAIEGMDGVEFLPVASVTNPHVFLQLAHLYVCSSRVEAFPLSIQEAKAYGLPVITTPVFGCSEIIHPGVDGLHYQPGDVADLRRKIEHIRANPGKFCSPLTHLPTFSKSLEMYEAVFREALGGPAKQPMHVVYHVAGMGPWWKSIVTEQLEQLRAVGLTRVLATHVGEEPNWLLDEAARLGIDLTLCEHQPDVKNYEVLAIRLIERLARHGDKPVLYLHAKGVTHPPEEVVWHEWRRLMMREVVGKWRQNLADLAGRDAVGVNWWHKPGDNHFSGNFWLASPEWIRKLPRFDSFYRDRYSCEVWIGSVAGCRVKSLVCNDRKFWDADRDWMLDYCKGNS